MQFGLPEDYYETYAGKVRALKTSDVEEGAKDIVHPDHLIWVVVGDRAKIEPGSKSWGWEKSDSLTLTENRSKYHRDTMVALASIGLPRLKQAGSL